MGRNIKPYSILIGHVTAGKSASADADRTHFAGKSRCMMGDTVERYSAVVVGYSAVPAATDHCEHLLAPKSDGYPTWVSCASIPY